ncbi:putative fumarate reductase flavoprotein subunit [Paraburkholderia piptadeniae]|uniref:Fumarate reductase flavoprotein subunit n=1 Tax=Paraburkholderia piptadeniae TaxID=1701573 RepID=A0A1N7SDS0_9BURK|nr:FAD-dependent tricarballylate dehydrogenase TcuA [Paraburkholderia piptadeniae]SIT45501.1 putative fumarate reductase flavoprotein subunit [Paraburkholderia piptadeniae]
MADYDVIVVGAGNAALAAAVSARENGAERVVVLEKAPRAMRGGNTHWSGGVLRFAFDDPREIGPLLPGVEKEFEDFYAGIQPYTRADFHGDLMRVTSGQTDPVLSRVLVDNSKDTVFWMHETGQIKMEPAVSLTGVRKGNQIIWARGLVVRAEHEGVGLSRSWFAAVERLGIAVRYGAAVTALLQDESGRVSGVRVRDDEGIHELRSRSVILGCGGFEANVQMRTQHIGPLVGGAKVRGTPHNQGDGLRMAMAIGAMPWGQWSGCHATPISADWGNFAPREMTDRSNRLSYLYGVMINRKGNRFVDEGEDGAMFTYAKYGRAILAEPGAKVYQLFDSKTVHLLEPRYSTSDPLRADTLEALIEQLDIDDKPRALKTLREYNAAAHDIEEGFDATGKDGLSTHGLTPEKSNWALKLDKPPFYAYSATGGITFTFGGVKVDEEARVIGTDWRPIRGLTACGEMVGGLFYDNYPAGTGLVSGATFGRIAGRTSARA